jgi:Ca-activated chloride channel family protein
MAAGPLGGALFEFDIEKMKPWACDRCSEPRFSELDTGKPGETPDPGSGIGMSGSLFPGGVQPDMDRSESPYFLVKSDDPKTDRLPLKSTRADVAITGSVAEVRVTQVYENEGKSTIEAVYTFPASSRAAVHAMRMTIGERTIEAVIKEKAEARKQYEEAKAEGKTASLLEQQRPNVFSMNVANILPGDVIKVEMIYNEMLVPEDGQYEFVYPTVVGPRYLAKTKDDLGNEAWAATEYENQGEKPDYTFGLDAFIDAPVAISCISSHTHEVQILKGEINESLVSLPESTEAGNRDFVLRYSLASEQIQSGALLHDGDEESFFMLMASPPAAVPAEQIVPREYVFVVDVSGSMRGFPLDVSRTLMKDLLGSLRKGDYFNLVFFSSQAALLAEKSIPATGANVDKAFEKMGELQGSGGTELKDALTTALALPEVGNAHRVVVVVTDGYIFADRECIRTIRENIDRASMFTFGIGTSVNRYLIDGLAHAGKGAPFVVTSQAEVNIQSARFRAYIDSPVMRDIDVSFDEFDAYDIEPSHIPVLFAGRPIVVLGKYRGKAEGKIVITGSTPAGKYEQVLDVGTIASPAQTEALRTLWAREAIRNLDDLTGNMDAASQEGQKVLELGLAYGLLTQFTSFVAIDSLVRADGDPKKVDQPLPLPEGVPQSALSQGIGLSGMGNIGHGGGGGLGSGYGLGTGGLTGRGSGPTPQIVMTLPTVTGTLSKEVIRRVIRQHVNQLRFCYEQELASIPDLSGKIVVEFTIDATGSVISAKIKSTTLGNSTVETCIVKALRSWKFPAPEGGGVVKVTYPFEFKPS